jgi:hypothetical protein
MGQRPPFFTHLTWWPKSGLTFQSGWGRIEIVSSPWKLVATLALSLTVLAQDPLPDFRLKDVGFGSPRRNTTVSPRDYQLQISAYYFTDAI